MKTNTKLHQLKLQQWAARISDQSSSGLNAKEWCTANGVSIHAYNYWKHLIKQELVDRAIPDIVPLSVPQVSQTAPIGFAADCAIRANCTNVRLSINGIPFELESSVPETFLVTLLKAVRYA